MKGSAARRTCLLLLASAVTAAAAAGCVRELPSHGRGLPYRVVETTSEQTVMDLDIVDFDGDGVDEVVDIRRSSGHPYYFLSIRRLRHGDLVPLVQRPGMRHFRRGGVADVDGDGLPEYFMSQRIEDRALLTPFDVRIDGEAAHIDSMRFAGPVVVPIEDYVTDGGAWDGRLFVSETYDRDGDGFRETILFVCSVGYAGAPRGVGRADLRTGRISWFRRFAGCPVPGGRAFDLDGDGEDELVVSLGAPGNGVRWAGKGDTTSYLAAVDLDGELIWERLTGGQSSREGVRWHDLDVDGDDELITWSYYGSADRPDSLGLAVRDPADGRVVARWLCDAMVNDVTTASLPGGGRAVFAVTDDGWIRRLRFADGGFVVDRAVRTPATVVERSAPPDSVDRSAPPRGAEPRSVEPPATGSDEDVRKHAGAVSVSWLRLDPLTTPVLCVGTSDGFIAVLDAELEPLAVHRTEKSVGRWGILPFVGEAGVRQAVVETTTGYFAVALTEVPPSAWPLVLLGLAGLAGAGACVPKVRRVSASTLRRWLTPAPERERQIEELLDELSVAGHGQLTATSTIRRLRGLLVMMHSDDGPAPASFVARYHQAADDLRRIGLPRIHSILKRAERTGVAPGAVERLRTATREFRLAMSDLPADPPGGAASANLTGALDGLLASLDAALRDLRRACRLELSASVMQELRRAARVHADRYVARGAELRIPAATPLEDVRVFGTSMEVSFILENLLSNALRAVEGAETKRVEVDLSRDGEEVVLTVRDTGTGVPTDIAGRLFERGVTSRGSGGGTGLAASREILERRGGSIRLVGTGDEGSTFEVRFEVC